MTIRIGLLTVCLLGFLAVSTLCELKLVINMNRHGARSPIYTRTDISSWKSQGQLTGVGMRQLYLMGQELRHRYIENTTYLGHSFLPQNYDSNQIYVRSTHLNRTIMSALSLLYGLYPNGTGPAIGADIPDDNWNTPFPHKQKLDIGNFSLPYRFQPVPVHLVKATKEYVMRSFDDDICINMKPAREESLKSENIKKILTTFEDLRQSLSDLFNVSMSEMNMTSMSQILDNTMMDYYEGNDIKITFGTPLWKKAMTFYNISIVYLKYATREMINLFSTRSFDYIIDYMDSVVEKRSPVKMVLLSGHDTSIMNLVVAMNLTSWECMLEKYINETNLPEEERFNSDMKCAHGTDLASALRFELHQKADSNTEYYVKVFYEDKLYPVNGKTETEYQEFKNLIKGFAVPNYNERCFELQNPNKENGGSSGSGGKLFEAGNTTILTYVFLVLLLVFSAVLAVLILNGCKEMGTLNRKIQAEEYRSLA